MNKREFLQRWVIQHGYDVSPKSTLSQAEIMWNAIEVHMEKDTSQVSIDVSEIAVGDTVWVKSDDIESKGERVKFSNGDLCVWSMKVRNWLFLTTNGKPNPDVIITGHVPAP